MLLQSSFNVIKKYLAQILCELLLCDKTSMHFDQLLERGETSVSPFPYSLYKYDVLFTDKNQNNHETKKKSHQKNTLK